MRVNPKFYVLLLLALNFSVLANDDGNKKYKKADSIASVYSRHSLDDLYGLVNKLTSPFQDEELKFRAIFTWVCKNIANDYPAFLRNDQKRRKYIDKPEKEKEWNRMFWRKMLKTLISKKKTVCTGYAVLIKEMAYYAGIESVIIDGYTRDAYVNIKGENFPNHNWNAAKINNKWIFVDAALASGINDADTYKFIPEFDDIYFMTNPQNLIWDHYPSDSNWQLTEPKVTLNQFLSGPLIYRTSIRHDIQPVYPENFETKIKKKEQFALKIQLGKSVKIEQLSFKIDGFEIVKKIKPKIIDNEKGIVEFNYTFKSKSLKVVHIYYSGEPVITYEVKVTG